MLYRQKLKRISILSLLFAAIVAVIGQGVAIAQEQKPKTSSLNNQRIANQKFHEKYSHEQIGRDIESMFIQQFLKDMYANISVDPNFGGGHAEEMYRQLFIEELAKEIPKKNGIGIARKITDDISSKYNAKQRPKPSAIESK